MVGDNLKLTERWKRVINFLPYGRFCRECRLMRVEAESIECPCLPSWPRGLKAWECEQEKITK